MKYLEFIPEIPLPLWLVLAGLAAGMLFWIAMRRRGRIPQGRWTLIVTFWATAVILILGVLLNPTWIERIPPPEGKPVLTILLDRSSGMATEDETVGFSERNDKADEKMSRWEKASTIAHQVAEELGNLYEVRVRTFAQRSEPTELAQRSESRKTTNSSETLSGKEDKKQDSYRPTGILTDIARSLEEAVDNDCPQGQAVLLLSDGCHNGMSGTVGLWESVEKIRAMNVPVYTKPFGTTTDVRDLAVSVDNPQELALSGGQLLSGVTVRRRGRFTDRVMVRLLLDGKEVAREELRFGVDDIARTVFPVKAKKPGLFRYEVTVDSKPGEITKANNRSSLLVRVVDEPVRVLLLEGKPYWDTKFLIRTLASDMSIDLTTLIRLQDDRYVLRHITSTTDDDASLKNESDTGNTEAPPYTAASTATKDTKTTTGDPQLTEPNPHPKLVRKDDWKIYSSAEAFFNESGGLNHYLVVVLGRDADVFLTEERVAELKRWVGRQEGALVCFRGPPASRIGKRLAEMLPVRWTPGREAEYRVSLSKAGHSASWLTAIGATNFDTEAEQEIPSTGNVEKKKKDEPSLALSASSYTDPFADLPTLRSSIAPAEPGPLAVVLAQRSGSGFSGDVVPVISWQPFGIGRVVVVEGAGMWRWAFLPKNKQKKNNVHALLWRSLLRRLVSNVTLLPNQRVAISTDKLTFRPNEPIGATLLTRVAGTTGRGKSLMVRLSGPTLKRPRLLQPVPQGDTPGRFRVLIGHLTPGRYQLAVSSQGMKTGTEINNGGNDEIDDVTTSTWFEVRDDLRERLDVQAQPGLLKKIADETGGKLLETENASDLCEEFDRHLTRSRPERLSRHKAWDRWWVLTLALACFATAWIIRRRSGLV